MRALAVSLLTSIAVLAQPAIAQSSPSPSPFDKSGIADWTKPPPPTVEPKFKPPVAKRKKLGNGMSVLVVENHALPIVSMILVVPGAGSAYDPKGKGGLASFTADLLDEGAGERSAIAIAEETDRLGASIGASADIDASYVSVSTLAKTLDPTLDLVYDLVTRPTFDAKEFERVKGDRLTSLELRRNRPREVASIVLASALFGLDSAYGHPTSGVREQFTTLGIDDAKSFYKERWDPSAMTLVIVGDVDSATLHAKLAKGFGAWKPAGVKRAAKVDTKAAKPPSRLVLVDRKEAAQSDVRIGIVGPDRKDRRFFQFEVFRTTLGDGFTSRLVQRLREQLGITYGAGASMDWRLAPGPFVIATAIVTPSTGQGIGEALKIVGDLAAKDVPAEELDKSKQNLIRALPARFDTNSGTAQAFAELVLFGLPDTWYARYADNVRKVTAKDVKAVAKAAAPADKLTIAVVGDMAKIRAELDKLALGEPTMHDLYGMPLAK